MFPWSVIPTAGCPSAAAVAMTSGIRAAPSSMEHSVCRCRCTKEFPKAPQPPHSSLAPPGPGPTGVVDDPVENHIGVTLTIERLSPPGKRRGEGLRPARDRREAGPTVGREWGSRACRAAWSPWATWGRRKQPARGRRARRRPPGCRSAPRGRARSNPPPNAPPRAAPPPPHPPPPVAHAPARGGRELGGGAGLRVEVPEAGLACVHGDHRRQLGQVDPTTAVDVDFPVGG